VDRRYFCIEVDKKYPYFCQACVVGKAAELMSKKDARYCTTCQSFIEKEYIQLGKRYTPIPHNPQDGKIDALLDAGIQNHMREEITKLSTSNLTDLTVDNFSPRGRPKTYKKKELPEGIIKQLHNKGQGSKAITTKLKTELGIDVSYKTIQRVLAGERK